MLDQLDTLPLLCNQHDRKSVPNRCRLRRVSETVDATINRSDECRRSVNQAFGREIVDLDGWNLSIVSSATPPFATAVGKSLGSWDVRFQTPISLWTAPPKGR